MTFAIVNVGKEGDGQIPMPMSGLAGRKILFIHRPTPAPLIAARMPAQERKP